eukprot:5991203-Pleurochrysis_carterae.AAC.1
MITYETRSVRQIEDGSCSSSWFRNSKTPMSSLRRLNTRDLLRCRNFNAYHGGWRIQRPNKPCACSFSRMQRVRAASSCSVFVQRVRAACACS